MAEPHNRGFGGFNGSGVGTNAGVSVTQAAATDANKRHFVTGIQVRGDATATVSVESPAGTLLWRKVKTAAFDASEDFSVPIMGAAGQAILVKISASTSACEANMQGYTDK